MVLFTAFLVFSIVAFALVLPALKKRCWPAHKGAFGGALACVLAIEAALAYFVFVRPTQQERAALESGLTAPGEIVSVRATGNRFNQNPELELAIRIRPAGEAPYVAKTTLIMHAPDVPKHVVGTQVTLLLDPEDRENFLVKGLNTP